MMSEHHFHYTIEPPESFFLHSEEGDLWNIFSIYLQETK